MHACMHAPRRQPHAWPQQAARFTCADACHALHGAVGAGSAGLAVATSSTDSCAAPAGSADTEGPSSERRPATRGTRLAATPTGPASAPASTPVQASSSSLPAPRASAGPGGAGRGRSGARRGRPGLDGAGGRGATAIALMGRGPWRTAEQPRPAAAPLEPLAAARPAPGPLPPLDKPGAHGRAASLAHPAISHATVCAGYPPPPPTHTHTQL